MVAAGAVPYPVHRLIYFMSVRNLDSWLSCKPPVSDSTLTLFFSHPHEVLATSPNSFALD